MNHKNSNDIMIHHIVAHYMHLGLLPFFIGAFGPWIFADYKLLLSEFFLFYASIILVFLAGTLWAIALHHPTTENKRHTHIGIIFSLWPLACYFFNNVTKAAVILVGFLLLLLWEKYFASIFYTEEYQKLRHKITFIVIACHMLVIWNLIGP